MTGYILGIKNGLEGFNLQMAKPVKMCVLISWSVNECTVTTRVSAQSLGTDEYCVIVFHGFPPSVVNISNNKEGQ